MDKDLFTIKSAASYLNSATITVRRLIKARKIGYHKIGSRYMISRQHIQAYLQSVDVPPVNGGAK
ncbi:MAG: excisionase family DNA-binding protein [Treponema sp.]|nr:excisionase family DNA-binding protein [Treponema sp.]